MRHLICNTYAVILLWFLKVSFHLVSAKKNCAEYYQYGVRLETEIFHLSSRYGLKTCGEECMYRKKCLSFNYCKFNHTCELLATTATQEIEKLVSRDGYYYGDISTWPMVEIGPCASRPCPVGKRCVVLHANQIYCVVTECSEPPVVQNASITSPERGVSKTINYTCSAGYVTIGNPAITCKADGTWTTPTVQCERPVDCKDVYELGNHVDGVYTIYPNGNVGYKVYCDMTTNGGGWTVFQKRFDGSVDFYRTWNEYMNGFGDVNGEYWLGNDKIHELTSQGSQTLRIDMMDLDGIWKYAKYDEFSISDNSTGYKLTAGRYHGNAGDSLTYHVGRMFETKDRQDSYKCATEFTGAWWYYSCHHSNLNGLYGNTEGGKGMNWYHWHGHYYSMKATEMKMRRM